MCTWGKSKFFLKYPTDVGMWCRFKWDNNNKECKEKTLKMLANPGTTQLCKCTQNLKLCWNTSVTPNTTGHHYVYISQQYPRPSEYVCVHFRKLIRNHALYPARNNCLQRLKLYLLSGCSTTHKSFKIKWSCVLADRNFSCIHLLSKANEFVELWCYHFQRAEIKFL